MIETEFGKDRHSHKKVLDQDVTIDLHRSYYSLALREFLRNKIAIVGGVLVLIEIIIAIFGPLIAPYDPLEQSLGNQLLPLFSPGHFLGTDDIGRDMLSRMIYGARISAVIGVGVVAIAASMLL